MDWSCPLALPWSGRGGDLLASRVSPCPGWWFDEQARSSGLRIGPGVWLLRACREMIADLRI